MPHIESLCRLAWCIVGAPLVATGAPAIFATNSPAALHRGVWEKTLEGPGGEADPFPGVDLRLIFTLPDGSEAVAEGFHRGGTAWAVRAYCSQTGTWRWRSQSNQAALDGQSGTFEVLASDLPGKLRKHPDDPRQFAYDTGEWFLHIGDTGYRYLTDGETLWQAYIDQAAQAGFNKIRTWFCRGRHDVQALFAAERKGLDLAYWDEIERRLRYALEHHPRVQFQLIPFGEDWDELRRYGDGEPMSQLMARYAQARFTAFPNVQWCISNDANIAPGRTGKNIDPKIIDRIARDLRRREPWGTLLTNHQRRFQGYSFAAAPWSDIVTLEDRDQVAGALILSYRGLTENVPVVLDEDRYGLYIKPRHPRYFFRRLFWASLLSGGHATYGGLNTYEPFDGPQGTKGMHGYLDAVRDGRLEDAAQDFAHIRRFFAEANLTLIGFQPGDALAGQDGHTAKAATNGRAILVYLQNPDGRVPETANVAETPAKVRLILPPGAWRCRWYDPRRGVWQDAPGVRGVGTADLAAPFPGDAVLLLEQP